MGNAYDGNLVLIDKISDEGYRRNREEGLKLENCGPKKKTRFEISIP